MNTSYHLRVMKIAFTNYVTPRGMDWLIRGNFNTDFYGSLGWKILEKKVFPLYWPARHWYKPIDHLDLCTNLGQLIENWNELRRRLAECAEDNVKYPPTAITKIFIAAGRAVHSLTDIYSHSNYVELLYSYYRNNADAAREARQSGLPLHEFIGKHAPTFTDVADDVSDKYRTLRAEYLEPNIFTDECLPDVGPRSHEETNKDSPRSKACANPEYPDLFNQVMAMAERDVCAIVAKFFDLLKEKHPEKFTAITQAFPGEIALPGKFERRAIFWSLKFDALE